MPGPGDCLSHLGYRGTNIQLYLCRFFLWVSLRIKSASSQSGHFCKTQIKRWSMGLWLDLRSDLCSHHFLAAQPKAQIMYYHHGMRCYRTNGADTEPWGPLWHTVVSTLWPARLFTSFLGVIVLTSNSGNSVHFSPSARCCWNIWLSGCVRQAL